jgi:hypothetical protein
VSLNVRSGGALLCNRVLARLLEAIGRAVTQIEAVLTSHTGRMGCPIATARVWLAGPSAAHRTQAAHHSCSRYRNIYAEPVQAGGRVCPIKHPFRGG